MIFLRILNWFYDRIYFMTFYDRFINFMIFYDFMTCCDRFIYLMTFYDNFMFESLKQLLILKGLFPTPTVHHFFTEKTTILQ
jgi:hypothetical protein